MNGSGINAPQDEAALLARVREAWAETLGLDSAAEVPVDANFMDTGGNSMLLIMLWEELSEMTDADLRVSDLFQHSTVKEQTVLLLGGARQRAEVSTPDRGQLLNRSRNLRAASTTRGSAK